MPQFTKAQKGQAEKLLSDVIESLNPSKDEFQQKVLDAKRAKLFQERLRAALVAMMGRYFIPLTDEEAVIWLVEQAKVYKSSAELFVEACRRGALEQGKGSDPCHYAVESGATLKETIPTLGPCDKYFKNNLHDTDSIDDIPTEHCLVSGVPAALRETTNQDMKTQLQTLRTIEKRWGIPLGFFSKALIPTVYTAGVALAQYNVTKRQMFGDLWVLTGSLGFGGDPLALRWFDGLLHLTGWLLDEEPSAFFLAVAPLGMTKALRR